MASTKAKSKGSAMTAPKGASKKELEETREERELRLAQYDNVDFDSVDAEEFTGGTTNKETLVGVDMKIVDVIWRQSTKGPGQYALVTAITRDFGKVIFSDGSTYGASGQLRKHLDDGKTLPLRVRQGLKYREYTNKAGIESFSWDLVGTPEDAEAKAVAAVGKTASGRAARSNGARA